ncbi:hypothetical protein DL546_009916 [Coniochaeta pulveracea]|uniref:Uncharacterized protein n=1 Tax=Coniochaeta pulveracea TaxID=177199 RepID=A0A420Y8B1_9PEZI|nr:hypothetical protein DL546_009916 [Coniochaeta pulveracea]
MRGCFFGDLGDVGKSKSKIQQGLHSFRSCGLENCCSTDRCFFWRRMMVDMKCVLVRDGVCQSFLFTYAVAEPP